MPMGSPDAEGATAPETLRQPDRETRTLWKASQAFWPGEISQVHTTEGARAVHIAPTGR